MKKIHKTFKYFKKISCALRKQLLWRKEDKSVGPKQIALWRNEFFLEKYMFQFFLQA
jgi:hypothetical protein